MSKRKVFAVSGVVVLAALWYLFRPELLFVNKTVNEGLPPMMSASAGAMTTLAAGQFHNGAHDTTGTASILQGQGGRYLRLTNFKTSNGPDVHVYLVAAGDAADNDMVKKAGFIDLGSIKGNEGDQNYNLPANTDLEKYRAVTIWCARFNVNFGTAPLQLAPAMTSSAMPSAWLSGQFHKGAHDTSGSAAIYRSGDGAQILRLTNFKTSTGPDVHVYLVAANDAADNDAVTKAGFTDLGSLKGNEGDQNYAVPAGVDLAKYRAVTIWCKRFSVNFGTAPLTQALPQGS